MPEEEGMALKRNTNMAMPQRRIVLASDILVGFVVRGGITSNSCREWLVVVVSVGNYK